VNKEEIENFVMAQEPGRYVCPKCSPDRKKKFEKTLNIQPDEEGVMYQCWHCEISGKVFYEKDFKGLDFWDNKAKVKAISKPKQVDTGLMNEYLISRGIDPKLITGYQVCGGTKYFPNGGEMDALGFVYGDYEAIKWRGIHEKYFVQDGSAKVLWGLENYREQEIKTLVITEGEIDCLSVVSAINSEAATKGIDPDSCLVLSVPNGAPQRVSNKRVDAKDDRKFSYLWHSKEIFESAEKIILALDDDEPGVALGEEIMRRVGRAKCYHLELPDNCKDSNDILRKHGAGMLVDLIREATPTPLVGVYSAADYSDDVNFLYERGLMGGKSTGFRDLDSLYTVLQGQLTVVTGLPGSGKSEWVDAVMVNLAEQHDWKFAVASFENPPPLHIIKLCEKRARLPFFEGRNERMTEEQMAEARSWVNDHFAFLDSKDGEPATVDSIIERTKMAVLRLGCRGLVIDPYNYIAQTQTENEHQSISEMLTRMVQFARSHDLHIWFIAHPAKMRANDAGKMPVPNGNHISGSAAWFAKADCGVTVQREGDHIAVHSWKCRFKWVGTVGECKLQYDPVCGRYIDWEGHFDPNDPVTWPQDRRRDWNETEKDWDISF